MRAYETEQRRRLLHLLQSERERDYTAEELAHSLADICSVSTVYRLLARLTEEGAVRRMPSPDGRHSCYRYVQGHECKEHLHLKCTCCGKMIHMNHDQTDAVLDAVQRGTHFRVDREETVLLGLCDRCMSQKTD